MTELLAGVAVALGLLAVVLFLAALRRALAAHRASLTAVVDRQAELVDRQAALAEAQDERLAELAEAIQKVIANAAGAGDELPAETSDDHEATMRTLEQAREAARGDGAIAIVAGGGAPPTFAMVGLSHAEAAYVARMGFPDRRGARALEVTFTDAPEEAGKAPVRSGLVLSLLESPARPSMIAVLTRQPDRVFSEDDVSRLERVVRDARPVLERSLGLRDPDPVPELDPVTGLFDRHALSALLDREVARALQERRSLALLVVDIDRLGGINARLGHLGGDRVIAAVGQRLYAALQHGQLAGRQAGGRYAVLVPDGSAHDAERLFAAVRDGIGRGPVEDVPTLSLSGGVAELAAGDTAAALLDRAEAALELAKRSGRGSVVSTAVH